MALSRMRWLHDNAWIFRRTSSPQLPTLGGLSRAGGARKDQISHLRGGYAMTPQDAIEILLSQPVIVIDDDEVAMNAEDTEPGALVVLEMEQRNEIVKLLERLKSQSSK